MPDQEASQSQLETLVSTTSDGYWRFDRQGHLLDVNEAYCRMSGYSRQELLQLRIRDLEALETSEEVERHIQTVTEKGFDRFESRHRQKNGEIFDVEISVSFCKATDEFLLFARDIGARNRTERTLRMLSEFHSVASELGQRALRGEPSRRLLDQAVTQVAQCLEVEYCKVLELLPDRKALLLRAGVGWKEGLVGRATVSSGVDSQAGYTLLSDQPVVVEDLASETRFSGPPLLHEHRVVSGMSVVIPMSEGPYGVLGAHTSRRRAFSQDEINFLRTVAHVLGRAVERERMQVRSERLNQALRVVSSCNQILIRENEESTLLQQICKAIVEEAGYRLCWVGEAQNDAAKSIRPVAQAGFEAGYLAGLNLTWQDVERGRSPIGTAIRTRETVVLDNVANDPRMALWRAEALKRGYNSVVAVPLLLNTHPFGAISIYAGEPDAFGAEEVALLSELAGDLAYGIGALRARAERAKGEAALREREEHVRLLLDSTAEAICGLDLEGNCTWVNRACLDMLGYQDASALLGKNFHSLAHYTRPDGRALAEQECRTSQALLRGEAAHVDDEVMWRSDRNIFPVEYWVHPVRHDGTLMGAVLTFLDVSERRRAETEIRILNAQLEQRVVARTAELEAANQAKDELIARERAISAELARARESEADIGAKIQKSLLMDQPPQDVSGLRIAALTIPSQRIDGDFFIFLKHSEQMLDVLVGDVMGTGISAALLGAAVKSEFLKAIGRLTTRTKPGELPAPQEIVMQAHGELALQLIGLESFVTLCYARVDARNCILQMVDCGHTGIIHWHAKRGTIETVHGDNLPLGVRENEVYQAVSVGLEPGDLLLFYSDGITEACDAGGEFFGSERLEDYVQTHAPLEPKAMVDGIRKAVFTFTGSARLVDDLTCVALLVEDLPAPLAEAGMELESDLQQLKQARRFVREFCSVDADPLLDDDALDALVLAVNEAASNIIRHAYHERSGRKFQIEAEALAGSVVVRLRHGGDPFDPSRVEPAVLNGSRESGFGTYIMEHSVDRVRYYRDERGQHCVDLVKMRNS